MTAVVALHEQQAVMALQMQSSLALHSPSD